jgi:predicted MFS family arabinose efflux permease
MNSQRCRIGLNGLNFFIGAMQTAFGPFFSVYLTERGWTQGDIGFALSVGTASALALQLPAGVMVDTIHFKRFSTAIALLLLGMSAMMLVAQPTPGPVLTAQVLHSFASCLLTPAIAALTLILCGHDAFSEQLGINARYASLGSAAAAALLGAVASYISVQAVFIVTTALVVPALGTLLLFRAGDRLEIEDHPAILHPRERKQRNLRPWDIYRDPTLHIFAVCVVLFHFANAAMLPLALNELTKRVGQAGFVVSAAIIVPQIVVMACSPWVGRLAQAIGRRPVLLVGFAALPLRGLLFATMPDAIPLVMMQILDGVSATVFGLMMPLIAADVTRDSGYLNLAIGSLGLAAGIGATASTTAAGFITDALGAPTAFIGLAVIGCAAVALLWRMMPETRPGTPFTGRRAVAAA